MEQSLYDQLLPKIYLKSDATQIIICLEDYLANFFLPRGQKELRTYFDTLPPEVSGILQQQLEKIGNQNQTEVKRQVLELEDQLRKCPVIHLTLAFQPDDAAVKLFAESIRQDAGPHTLLELQYDKTIVAGALIVAGGKYKDHSIRKKLADRFQIQKDDIMRLLR